MKVRLFKLVVILFAFAAIFTSHAFAYEATLVNSIEVTSYDDDINYMEEILQALEDGSEYALQVASIYEEQRNMKIDDLGLDLEKTYFLNSGMSVSEIIEAIEAYLYGSAYKLTAEERLTVEAAVMAEAGYESLDGKMMIAQCILDTAIEDKISIAQVISNYQIVTNYSNINVGCREAVKNVFDLGMRVTEETANVWYAPAIVYSSWHESQIYVITIGGHKFFRTRV